MHHWTSFDAFQRSVEKAAPIADAYLMAVKVAKAMGAAKTPKLHDILIARPLGEQMLRVGAGWGEGDMAGAPAVSDDVQAVIVSRLLLAAGVEDHDNTEWLKALVAKQGWPKRSDIGEDAAEQAWLLVQHADADPAFQLSSLRLMEPLMAKGEVAKGDYAYLCDRVMLKITASSVMRRRQRVTMASACRSLSKMKRPSTGCVRTSAGALWRAIWPRWIKPMVAAHPPAAIVPQECGERRSSRASNRTQ